jgi:hypothetical protein
MVQGIYPECSKKKRGRLSPPFNEQRNIDLAFCTHSDATKTAMNLNIRRKKGW